MPRHLLPRPIARGRLRHRTRLDRTRSRRLRLENLEPRVVLSGLPEVAIATEQPADSAPIQPPPVVEQAELVTQSDDGVVRVQPPTDDTEVVVRQFINYRLQEVVEVEMAGRWTSFASDAVKEVQVFTRVPTKNIQVLDGVTKTVRPAPVEVVDAVFSQHADAFDSGLQGAAAALAVDLFDVTADALPQPQPDNLASVSPLAGADAEGEGPPGGSGEPLLPPTIVDFASEKGMDTWAFSGQVIDDKDVVGLTVTFGGLLDGMTTTVGPDGYFEIFVGLPNNAQGSVTAQTTDRDGLESNVADLWVS